MGFLCFERQNGDLELPTFRDDVFPRTPPTTAHVVRQQLLAGLFCREDLAGAG